MKIFFLLLCAFMVTMIIAPAYAGDINFGSYARSEAMGGAGLALTDGGVSSSIVNPAALAAACSGLRFVTPSFDLQTSGASVSDLQDSISDLQDSDDDGALALAKTFGTQDTKLGVSMTTGITGAFGLTAEGEAIGLITPGDYFKEWASAGAPTDLNAAYQDGSFLSSSLIGQAIAGGATTSEIAQMINDDGTSVSAQYVYSLPAVNCGTKFNMANGRMLVGTKVRWLNSETHSWDVVATGDDTTGELDVDVQENSNDYYEDDGIAADLGLIFQPKKSLMQFGVVVNNMLNPNLKGIDMERMISLGVASQPNTRFTYAIDLININDAYDDGTHLRMGAELALTKKIALRAGHCEDGWTYGVGFYGLNVAFAGDAPRMISKALRF
ncbi:MAG: hypothetical protein ABFD49_01975 [Armatimonadota bacterium]|nr:hypothetical protein [bacterium]